jgi:signal transduction histidine kinase
VTGRTPGTIASLAAPIITAAIGLVGALAATLYLHHAATTAVERVLQERLQGAGQSAAALLGRQTPSTDDLRAVARSNELDGALLVADDLRVVADADGQTGRRADLLRVDPRRLAEALAGTPVVVPGYAMGSLTVLTGYFPVVRLAEPAAGKRDVLVLEAGQTFVAAQARLARARNFAVFLALLSALGLAVVGGRFARAQRARQQAATQAARGELLSRLAAMAAHEIRNPLGVIRGTVDLMRERAGVTLGERDRQSLDDITGEVDRLRRLTEDLLSLASDRPLSVTAVDLGGLLQEVARGTEAAFQQVRAKVAVDGGSEPLLSISGDPALLRQVFANLLSNAAQANQQGEINVALVRHSRTVEIAVTDQGPGVPPEIGDRLFQLYFTTKSEGTGLGLAIARRIVERHDGTLVLRRDGRPGATFIVTLPIRPVVGHNR